MKKMLICTAILIGFSSAEASGPYIGVGLGFSDTRLTYIERETGFDDITRDYSISGPTASIFGGYRHDLNESVFVAIEANLLFTSASGGETLGEDELTLEQTSSLGGAALLGTQLGSGTIYGRVGLQQTEYKLSITGVSDTLEEKHSGFRLGLGYEIPLKDNLYVQMNWNRTLYGEETYFSEPGFSIAFEPAESLFGISLTTKF